MVSGEERVTIDAEGRSRNQIFGLVEDALSELGDCRVSKRGDIDIEPRGGLAGALTTVRLGGQAKERKGDTYAVSVEYTIGLSGGGWAILIIGLLFFLIGLAVVAAPFMAKDKVSRAVRRALSDIE